MVKRPCALTAARAASRIAAAAASASAAASATMTTSGLMAMIRSYLFVERPLAAERLTVARMPRGIGLDRLAQRSAGLGEVSERTERVEREQRRPSTGRFRFRRPVQGLPERVGDDPAPCRRAPEAATRRDD